MGIPMNMTLNQRREQNPKPQNATLYLNSGYKTHLKVPVYLPIVHKSLLL